ncbi:MAG: hypothetical protein ACUVUD_06650 [bacterium]
MIILEPIDLEVLRIAEGRGYFPEDADLKRLGLADTEYQDRLERFVTGGIVRSFHLMLVVPPLLGGEWVMAAVQIKTDEPRAVAQEFIGRLPFVTEFLINSSLPAGVGHNLAFIFYSRDFETEARFIQNFSSISEAEIFRVEEYTFPVSLPLSREEWAFVRFLYQNPKLSRKEIAQAFGQSDSWVEVKIARLLWSQNNPSGVFRIQPRIDWSPCANFGHFHFLLETGHRPEVLRKLLVEAKFELVFGGKEVDARYIEVEADVWGIAELLDRVKFLNRINGVRVAGVLYNQEIIINDSWVKNIIPFT